MQKKIMNKIKIIIGNILWSLRGGYDPQNFWEGWGKTFVNDPWQHKIYKHHKEIFKLIQKDNPKKILDIGCGFGRNIKFLLESGMQESKLTGVDISSSMIKSAKKYLKGNSVALYCAPANELPFKAKSFDFGIVHSVLMHVSPNKIDTVMNELKRVIGGGKLVVVEQNYRGDESSMKYTFIHDYKALFKKHAIKIEKIIKYKKDGYDLYFLTL